MDVGHQKGAMEWAALESLVWLETTVFQDVRGNSDSSAEHTEGYHVVDRVLPGLALLLHRINTFSKSRKESVKLERLPEYLRDTVDWFMGKARRKEREGEAGAADPKLYLQEALLERKLPELDMRALVELPRGLDYNEWLASHTLALFDHVNLLYGAVSEFCTAASCPEMSGPGGRAYAWLDERGKKSRLAAPHYVDYVMTYTQKTVNDETVFPTKYANEFPAAFEATVRRVARLLFHVVAHMYAAHFRELALLRLHAHLHLTFAHLTALDARFHLLDHKETEVLRDLEVALRLTEGAPGEAAPAPEEASPRRRSPVVTQPLATA